MKTLTLLKTLTAVMALIIIAGSAFVVYKIADSKQKSNPTTTIKSEFLLPFPESIDSVTACGDRLCLMTTGHQKGRRLLIINPTSGSIQTVLTFKEQ